LHDSQLDRRGHVDSDGRAFIELGLDFQAGRQPLRGVSKIFVAQGNLLVILGVHEMMMRAVGVKIFHLMLLEGGAFNRISRAKAMLER
jgi:hypothetical protein